MTFMESPSKNIRFDMICEIRDHLTFLHENGGTGGYSYEKIAVFMNDVLGTQQMDKGDARRFLIGDNKLVRPSADRIAALLNESRTERAKVENHLSNAFHSVVVTVPLTPTLVEVFAKHAELLLLVDPKYIEKISLEIQRAGFDVPVLKKD